MLATHQLTKRYGPVTALENCTLEIGKGEVFGLLGPNGAGKSTAIKLFLGLIKLRPGPPRCWASSLTNLWASGRAWVICLSTTACPPPSPPPSS